MQQYRVNYTLLIGLIIGTFVCSGAVYGLWRFQIERKSGWLISEAEKARAEGNLRDATQFYGQYLSIHSEDNDARFKFANAQLDLTEKEDATTEDLGGTARILETMLRSSDVADLPEARDIRRRLVTLYSRDSFRNFSAALDHINLLLEASPNDPDLQVLRASNLAKSGNVDEAIKYSYQLIGYDPKTDKFDVKKATAPNAPQVYATLALLVRSKFNKPELAERIVDQMVEVNPKSADAYLQRGRLHAQWNNADGARADGEKAYQLKPDDIDVLLFVADVASREKQNDKANEYIAKAKKLHPDEARVYQAAAALNIKQQSTATGDEKKKYYDQAMAEVEEGIKKVSRAKALELQFFKAELQIPAGDVKGARQTIEELQQSKNLRAEVIDYFDARIMLAEGKWFEASESLNKLRSKMMDFGRERVMEVDYSLGLCYERLGRLDMAKDQYELVLQQDSTNEPAAAGVQRVDAAIQPGERSKGDPLQELIAAELKKPKDQQDWTKIDNALQELAKKRQLDPAVVKLIQAQIFMMREDFDGATKALAEANQASPKNLQVYRAMVTLTRVNPKAGPAKALAMLDKVVAQFGDSPGLRLDKADILIMQSKDQQDKEPLKHALANLLTGIDTWTPQQKVELWGGMAGRYLNLGMPEEARQYLNLAADNQPNELPLRLALFSLALDAGDDAGMKDAQDKILQIVKDKNDSAWLFAEARRNLLLLRRGRLAPDQLDQIRSLVNQALQQRPEWFELYALLAEIELIANNGKLALENYDKAEELGRPTPSAVAQHIRLLAGNGRYADAGKLLDRIPEGARQALLGQLYAEILFRSNQVEAALKQAKTATETDPSSAQNQYWYGQLLARSSQAPDVTPQKRTEIMANAIKAMQRATDLQPEFPDAWFALINYYAMQKDEAQAQKTLRDAQLALSGDNLQIFLARSYEVLHRWFDAETMYREIYETSPDDLGRAQQLAAFYLGPLYQRPDRAAKVTPLINKILKAGAEKKVAANDGNLLWARRMAAKMLSSTNDYQNLVKSEKLLASNSQDGNLLIEDKLAMAEILAPRPEPVSRLKAISLLEDIAKVQPLNEPAEIQLSELYLASTGNWPKYKGQIEKTIATFPKSAEARQTYIRRLLSRGDPRSLDEASKQIAKLGEVAPNSSATFELSVRLASKLGNQKQVRAQLLSRMPKLPDTKEVDLAQAQSFKMFADLLIELGDLDTAEKIYADLANRNPVMALEYAKFLGQHRDADKCFAKLEELYKPANITDILNVAMAVVRDKRDKIGDKYDAQIQHWLDAGLRENPDSIPLLVVQADLYDLQKKYQDSASVYRKMLARDDLVGLRRAIVLNNLAFLLALDTTAKAGGDDPMKLVQEAAQIMGPNSDILDTRAVVLISQKQYKQAIQDLELSVTDNPTASKYFHKAVAHLGANENRAALEAWQKAEALGLSREALNRMEFEQYDQMKAKVDQIRKPSVTQAEPARKAG